VEFPLDICGIPEFPRNTALFGSVIMINVGGPSPDWVLQLVKTESGERLLRKILAGIYWRHLERRLLEELAQKLGLTLEELYAE